MIKWNISDTSCTNESYKFKKKQYFVHTSCLLFACSVCRKPYNFSLVLSNAVVRSLEFRSTPSGLFSLKLMFERSKSESVRDVSVTRVGDTFYHSFPQTVMLKIFFVFISPTDRIHAESYLCCVWFYSRQLIRPQKSEKERHKCYIF